MSWQVRTVWYRVVYGDSIGGIKTVSIRFHQPSKWGSVKKTGRIHENLWCTPWGVSWKSADWAHIPADLWPLKRYGAFARFLCICLRSHIRTTISPRWARYPNWIMRSEVTHLDPLSRGFQIETPSRIQTMVSWKFLATAPIPRPTSL